MAEVRTEDVFRRQPHVMVMVDTASGRTVTVFGVHPDTLLEFADTVYVPGGVAERKRPCDDVVVLWW